MQEAKIKANRNNRWHTESLMNSSEKMKTLNSLKRNFTLMSEDLEYIKNNKKYTKKYYTKQKKETMIGMSQRHLTKLKPCGS
jgi:hypothetical protein